MNPPPRHFNFVCPSARWYHRRRHKSRHSHLLDKVCSLSTFEPFWNSKLISNRKINFSFSRFSSMVMRWIGMLLFFFWGRLAFSDFFFQMLSCSISLHGKPQNSFRNGQIFEIFQNFRFFQIFRIFLVFTIFQILVFLEFQNSRSLSEVFMLCIRFA